MLWGIITIDPGGETLYASVHLVAEIVKTIALIDLISAHRVNRLHVGSYAQA